MQGLLVLAVDGLDWPLLLSQSAAGRMPHLGRALERGVQARLALPALTAASAAARWASIACGAGPSAHGIAHDLVCRADGLRLEPPTAADQRVAPLWQLAWRAGLDARVAGWPATDGSVLPDGAGPGSVLVADGFQRPEPGLQGAWPLAPGAVVPAAARALVRAARMHPAEVSDAMVDALLPAPAPPTALRIASADLLARWASVHNLGVHWCEEGVAQLVMLRLDGLPAWQDVAAACGLASDAAQACWLAWLDLLLGRYAALLGGAAHLMLVSDRGIDGGSPAAGGLLVAGDDTASRPALQDWPALLPAEALLPMALDLLRQRAPGEPAPSAAVADAETLIVQDTAALAWLYAQGVAAVDLSALRRRADAVRQSTRRLLRGTTELPPAKAEHGDE